MAHFVSINRNPENKRIQLSIISTRKTPNVNTGMSPIDGKIIWVDVPSVRVQQH